MRSAITWPEGHRGAAGAPHGGGQLKGTSCAFVFVFAFAFAFAFEFVSFAATNAATAFKVNNCFEHARGTISSARMSDLSVQKEHLPTTSEGNNRWARNVHVRASHPPPSKRDVSSK